jgi:hypothetical protein
VADKPFISKDRNRHESGATLGGLRRFLFAEGDDYFADFFLGAEEWAGTVSARA